MTVVTSGCLLKTARIWSASWLAYEYEIEFGIVARTYILPSSSFGMNSPPRRENIQPPAMSAIIASPTVIAGRASVARNALLYPARIHLTRKVSRSPGLGLSTSDDIAGEKVSARINAPQSARP